MENPHSMNFTVNSQKNTISIDSVNQVPKNQWVKKAELSLGFSIDHFLSISTELFCIHTEGFEQATSIKLHMKRPGVVLIASHCGKEIFYSYTTGSIQALPPCTLNLFNAPSGQVEIVLPQNAPIDLYLVITGYKRAEEFLSDEGEYFKPFVRSVEKGSHCSLFRKPLHWNQDFKFLLLRLKNCIQRKEQVGLYVQSLVLDLLLYCEENKMNIERIQPKISYTNKSEKIAKAKELIDKDWRDMYSIERLCKEVGLNATQLKEGFKESYTLSIYKYQNKLRLENTKPLLAQNLLSIAEVAEIAGYKNHQHYSAAFKKEFGMTPMKFRKKEI